MRKQVLNEISRLLDGKCNSCKERAERERTLGKLGHYAKMDAHCLHECPIGAQLKELGDKLGRGLSPAGTEPRRKRREWMTTGAEPEEEDALV